MLWNRVPLKNANVNDLSNDLEEATRNSSMHWVEWRFLFGEKIRILSKKKVCFFKELSGAYLENLRDGFTGSTKNAAHDWSGCTKAKVRLTMHSVCVIFYPGILPALGVEQVLYVGLQPPFHWLTSRKMKVCRYKAVWTRAEFFPWDWCSVQEFSRMFLPFPQ